MAGSKSSTFENSLLKLIYNNVAIPNIGDSSGLQPSAADGNLYIRLFTTATVNDDTVGTEASYTGYSMITIARTSAGFTIVNSTVSNTALIQFGECTANPETLRYFGVFTDPVLKTNAYRLNWGQMPSDLQVVVSLNPTVPAGYLTINEN